MTGRRLTAASLLCLAVLLVPPADAVHPGGTLPLAVDEEPLAAVLDRAAADGCTWQPDDASCSMGTTVWWAHAVAGAGLDPAAWPSESANLVDWMLANHEDFVDASGAGDDVGLALSILGVAAAGLDARALDTPDGATRDLIEELLAHYEVATGFGPARDDIFALLAFNAAGYDGSEVDQTVLQVEAAQHPAGGWSYTTGAEPTVDMTGWALAALAPHDRQTTEDRALDFLAQRQAADGDWRACWTFADDPTAESTAAATQGLVAVGEDPADWAVDGQRPTQCLARFVHEDGSVSSRPGGGSALEYQVVTGLTWAPYGTLGGPRSAWTDRVVAEHGASARLAVPGGFLRLADGSTASETDVDADARGRTTYHGFTWDPSPRPAHVVLEVPGLPGAPNVTAPSEVEPGLRFPVRLSDGGPWADGYRLELPNGTILAGADHRPSLPAVGNHTFRAWAVNAFGEVAQDGAVRFTVHATSDPVAVPPNVDVAPAPPPDAPASGAEGMPIPGLGTMLVVGAAALSVGLTRRRP